jgi:hypothetical protein
MTEQAGGAALTMQPKMDEEVPMSAAFDSNETGQMSRALSQAFSRLKPEGLMNGDNKAIAKAALAKAIVDAAEQGMTSEAELVAFAIANYSKARDSVRERDRSNDTHDETVKR